MCKGKVFSERKLMLMKLRYIKTMENALFTT